MKIAFVNDNKIIKIEDHNDFSTIIDSHLFQTVIDITDLIPQPEVGWLWDGKFLFKNIPSVTPRQIRQALVLTGISIETIEATLAGLPEPTKSLATIEWEYSTLFIRNNNFVKQLGPMLGFTNDQLDQLWLLAGKL